MARNSSGVYSLPQAAFVANTIIASAIMNSNLSDIATALTTSLATTGVSSMTGPIKAAAGTLGAPCYTLASDSTTGWYNSAAGEMTYVSAGTAVVKVGSVGLSLVGTGLLNDASGNVLGTTPIGGVIDYAGSTAPAKWLLCAGQQVSTTTYSALFAILSTTYGSGAGTFGIPDLRGRATFGKDNMGGSAANRITATLNFDGTVLGNSGGAQSFTMTTTQLPAHTHTITDPTHSHTMNAQNSNANAWNQAFSAVPNAGTSATSSASTGITGTNSTGTGSAFSILSPAFILNKIIYAGV